MHLGLKRTFFVVMISVTSLGGGSAQASLYSCIVQAAKKVFSKNQEPAFYPHASDPSFRSLKLDLEDGYNRIKEEESLFGNIAHIKFQPKGQKAANYTGRMIGDSKLSITLLDERTGKITAMHRNSGTLLSVKVQPNSHTWKSAYSADEFEEALHGEKSALGLIELSDEGKDKIIYGELNKVGKFGDVYSVTDRHGNIHQLDLNQKYFVAHITESNPETKTLFQNLPQYPHPLQLITKDVLTPDQGEAIISSFKSEGHLSTQVANQLSPESAFKVGPLSKPLRENFISNLDLMGINKVKYDYPRMGSEDDWSLLFHYGIGLMSEQTSAHGELANILTRAHADASALRTDLNAWAVRHKIPFQFAFYDDIAKLAPAYQAQGLFSSRASSTIGVNGYINENLYNRMVVDGIYSIADPHDVVSHLSSLLNPKFTKSFNQYTTLMTDISTKLNPGDFLKADRLRKTGDFLTKAYVDLREHLQGTLRDATHENWSYLIRRKKSGKQTLFLQGNSSYNGLVNGIMSNERSEFIGYLFHSAKLTDKTLGTEEISNFEGIQQFRKSSKAADQLYKTYRDELKRHALDRTSLARQGQKIEKFLNDRKLITGRPSYQGPDGSVSMRDAERTIELTAEFISKDPELSYIFSKEGNEHLISSAIPFLESYKKWVDELAAKKSRALAPLD